MRFATIDVGTNTAQLLVVEASETGLTRVRDVERFVRLGEGVDACGRIGEAAQQRLLAALRDHVDTAAGCDADVVVVGATSAMRDASNQRSVCRRIRKDVGLDVEVLTGAEEATWSFAAACAPFGDLTGDVLVVDVGGGSTELVVGHNPSGCRPHYADAVSARVSLDVGCIRLTERCFDAQPPSAAAVRRADQMIEKAVASALGATAGTALEVAPETVLVGTAGTATALALVDAGPRSTHAALRASASGDPSRDPSPGVVLTADCIRQWRDRLLRLSVDDIYALHPRAMEGRADVFPAGVMLLDHVLRQASLSTLRVSPYELRFGLALRAWAQFQEEDTGRETGGAD